MKAAVLVVTLILVTAMNLLAQNDSYKLPAVWTADFTISFSHSSSMSGSSTSLKLTHDQGTYIVNGRQGKPVNKTFSITKADRKAILARMHALKMDQIKSEQPIAVVSDGWSTSVCFDMHCIEGGSSSEMDEDNKNRFLDGTRYLEDFAVHKKATKKK